MNATDDMLATAIALSRRMGAVQREGLSQPIEVLESSRHDVKLAMDVRCEAIARETIRARFPDHAILGEEGGGEIDPAQPTWIIDPLDGTANYARRIPHFCISLAVQIECRYLLGVIYDPVRDELFRAVEGGGSWLNDHPITVSDRPLEQAVIAMGFAKTMVTIEKGLREMRALGRNIHKMRMMGAAALDFAYVAAGRIDGFIEYGLRTWDLAAGTLLIREAGGQVILEEAGRHRWNVRVQNGRLW